MSNTETKGYIRVNKLPWGPLLFLGDGLSRVVVLAVSMRKGINQIRVFEKESPKILFTPYGNGHGSAQKQPKLPDRENYAP